MGLQDRDYIRERAKLREEEHLKTKYDPKNNFKNQYNWQKNTINNITDRKLKNLFEDMTLGNLIVIILIMTIVFTTLKIIAAKIEENEIKNIAEEATKRMNEITENENKMMQQFIKSSNENIQQIQNSFIPQQYQQPQYQQPHYEQQQYEQRTNKIIRGYACIRDSKTNIKTCKIYK